MRVTIRTSLALQEFQHGARRLAMPRSSFTRKQFSMSCLGTRRAPATASSASVVEDHRCGAAGHSAAEA
jgi:hypothetical protein